MTEQVEDCLFSAETFYVLLNTMIWLILVSLGYKSIVALMIATAILAVLAAEPKYVKDAGDLLKIYGFLLIGTFVSLALTKVTVPEFDLTMTMTTRAFLMMLADTFLVGLFSCWLFRNKDQRLHMMLRRRFSIKVKI